MLLCVGKPDCEFVGRPDSGGLLITIREIPYGSDLYERSKRLREEVLRRPLGLELNEQDVATEEIQIHIAAIVDDTSVVGTVILKPLTLARAKLRQMAVSPGLQGTGTGRALVQHAEAVARERGFRLMEMHARVSARGFYEKLGYSAVGEQFVEATVPAIKMSKTL
jgi:GNAT superfamily N-acetyltransferase